LVDGPGRGAVVEAKGLGIWGVQKLQEFASHVSGMLTLLVARRLVAGLFWAWMEPRSGGGSRLLCDRGPVG
jgi:hypothetical protein